MRDNKNFILVRDYRFQPGLLYMHVQELTRLSARIGIVAGVTDTNTKVEVYCRTRTSRVYQLASELGFREEIRG